MKVQDEEKAPLFKNWNYWYVLVVAFLFVLIISFYFFTKHFS
ncbi:MAG TPA: hypothetical protein VKT28_08155 [Puia sp.]|nr:hypothetical protein [Puia sp.]